MQWFEPDQPPDIVFRRMGRETSAMRSDPAAQVMRASGVKRTKGARCHDVDEMCHSAVLAKNGYECVNPAQGLTRGLDALWSKAARQARGG